MHHTDQARLRTLITFEKSLVQAEKHPGKIKSKIAITRKLLLDNWSPEHDIVCTDVDRETKQFTLKASIHDHSEMEKIVAHIPGLEVRRTFTVKCNIYKRQDCPVRGSGFMTIANWMNTSKQPELKLLARIKPDHKFREIVCDCEGA